MEERNPEEMRFAKLAEKLGESLETVWNMAEAERSQLLALLLIDEQDGEVNGNVLEEDGNNAIKPTNEQKTNQKFKYFDEHSSEVSSSNEERNNVYKELQLDTDRVKRLLVGSPHENMEDAQIFAYLEAHMKDPGRVKVVVEELLGVNEEMDSVFLQDMSEESYNIEKGKGKGKGQSKLSSLFIHTAGLGGMKRPLVDNEDEPKTRKLSKFMFFNKRSSNIGNSPDLKAESSNSNYTNVKDEKDVNLEVDIEVVEISDLEITSSDSAESVDPSVKIVQVPDIMDPDKEEAEVIESHDTKEVKEKLLLPAEYSEACLRLADIVSDMFPRTPLDYIRYKCRDLVGKESEIEKFTLELLSNPTPPESWNRLKTELMEAGPSDGSHGSGSSAGPSHGSHGSSVSSVEVWETEKWEQLQSMFPTVCPQYLLNRVQEISAGTKKISLEHIW